MAGRGGLKAVALALLAVGMAAAPGSARVGDPSAAVAEAPQPQTALTCAWTMMRTSVAVGRRCRVTPNPGLQSTLEHSVSRLEDHVRETAPAFMAQIEEHRRRIDAQSDARLCTADAVSFYGEMGGGEPEALRDETDRVISLPGAPAWGDCA